MKRMMLFSTLFALFLAAVSQAAPDDQKAAVLLQAAQVKETIQGDLKGAIALYKEAADEAKANRPVAAKALLALGMAYQTTGTGDAQAVFARIVREFGDQTAVAAAARARLADLPRGRGRIDEPRQLFSSDSLVLNDISRDGQWAVGDVFLSSSNARSYDMVLVHLATGQRTKVLAGAPGGYAMDKRLAPDGRQIAYRWIENAGTPNVSSTLRVVAAEAGGTARTIAGPSVQLAPKAWSPDGKSVLAIVAGGIPGAVDPTQLVWVNVGDKSARRIKTFDVGREPSDVTLSPDARWIAYAAPPRKGSSEQHIYVMANGADREELDIVKMAGNNSNPAWTSDGRYILFLSDRSGRTDLWSVLLDQGTSAGESAVLKTNFSGTLIGVSSTGALYYINRTNIGMAGGVVLVADRNPAGAQVVQAFSGTSPSFSPDGKRVAFARPTASQALELTLRSLDTGEEQRFPHPGGMSRQAARWLHNGTALIAFVPQGGDGNRPGGSFYRVDAKTGGFKWLFARNTDAHLRSRITVVSPDDTTMYLAVRETSGTVAWTWTGIVGADINTGAEHNVASFPAPGLLSYGGDLGLALSPDGTTLAILTTSDPVKREARLVTVRTDGSGFRTVYGPFPMPGTSDLVRWTPDGSAIVFPVIDATGAARIMRISRDGGAPILEADLGRLSGSASVPAIGPSGGVTVDLSADGSRIAFDATKVSTMEVWSMDNVASLLGKK